MNGRAAEPPVVDLPRLDVIDEGIHDCDVVVWDRALGLNRAYRITATAGGSVEVHELIAVPESSYGWRMP